MRTCVPETIDKGSISGPRSETPIHVYLVESRRFPEMKRRAWIVTKARWIVKRNSGATYRRQVGSEVKEAILDGQKKPEE